MKEQSSCEHENTISAPKAWQQQADLLGHLSQFSQNILCVVAPPQSGKTQFLNYFLNTPTSGLKKHAILQPVGTVDELMKNLAKEFDLDWQDANNSNAIQENLVQANSEEKTWVLLVDDADQWPKECLFALLKLTRFDVSPKRQLHIILFGQPDLERTLYIREFQELLQGRCHTLELAQIQTKAANQASKSPRPKSLAFDDGQLNEPERAPKIKSFSSGFFKKSNQENQGAVMAQAESTQKFRNYLMHPITFGAAAGIGLGIVYLMLNPLDDVEWQSPPTNAAQLAEVTFQHELNQPTVSPTAKVKVEIAAETIPEEELFDDKNIASKIPLAEQLPKLADAQNITSSQKKTPVEKSALKKVSRSLEKISRAPKTRTDALTREEQYLLSANGNRYTLQLMGGHNEASIKNFIKQHKLNYKAYTYRKVVNGKDWYVLVLGNYDDKLSAEQALQNLPQGLTRQVQPWVRSMGSIQDEISSSSG